MSLMLLLTACATDPADTAVRATLSDGQVLMGVVQTETLLLDGALGMLEIPLSDVGEVVPVEGDKIDDSEGMVTVWLRNGSELTGFWAEAELAIGIQVGGDEVTADLPVEEMTRFQLQAGQSWPESQVFRVRTIHGDDFLVDPWTTHVVIENELGTFSPTLSECVRLEPVGDPDGDWVIELGTGTVLIGPLAYDSLNLALPMGPETLDVPLEVLVSIERQDWSAAPGLDLLSLTRGASRAEPVQAAEAVMDTEAIWQDHAHEQNVYDQPAPALQMTEGDGTWFTNEYMAERKKLY